VTGRDFPEKTLPIQFEPHSGRWTIVGDAAERRLSESRRRILKALRDSGDAMSPKRIAEVTCLPPSTVRRLIRKLHEAGLVDEREGKYTVASRS
jgi:DNA-binding IclR family transcriptional regulator